MQDNFYKLVLLRHGQTAAPTCLSGQLDISLSQAGQRQLENARSLIGSVDTIATSHLTRCLSFAQSWAKDESCPLHIDERFSEYHFGEWEGKPYTEISKQFPGWQNQLWHGSLNIPGAENQEDFSQRIWSAYMDWAQYAQGNTRLLICHGGTITVLLARLLHIPIESARHIGVFRGGFACLSLMPGQKTWLTTLYNPDAING